MAKSINRRAFAIGTAVLASGLMSAPMVFAKEREGSISIRIDGAERLKGLSGKKLREQLAKSLMVSVEAQAEAVEMRLIAVRVGKGGEIDTFESRALRKKPGRTWWLEADFPGDQGFPGDMFFPGEYIPQGTTSFPGDHGYPKSGAQKMAVQVAQKTLGEGIGWFFVVVAADEGMRSAGVVLQ